MAPITAPEELLSAFKFPQNLPVAALLEWPHTPPQPSSRIGQGYPIPYYRIDCG